MVQFLLIRIYRHKRATYIYIQTFKIYYNNKTKHVLYKQQNLKPLGQCSVEMEIEICIL